MINLTQGAVVGFPAAFASAVGPVSGMSRDQFPTVGQARVSVSWEHRSLRTRTSVMTDKAYGLDRTSREKPL